MAGIRFHINIGGADMLSVHLIGFCRAQEHCSQSSFGKNIYICLKTFNCTQKFLVFNFFSIKFYSDSSVHGTLDNVIIFSYFMPVCSIVNTITPRCPG